MHKILEGVFRKGDRCFPDMQKQEDVKRDDSIKEYVWTIKVAKLEVENSNEIISATSVYDSKPVYLLSSSCTETRWI